MKKSILAILMSLVLASGALAFNFGSMPRPMTADLLAGHVNRVNARIAAKVGSEKTVALTSTKSSKRVIAPMLGRMMMPSLGFVTF